MSRDRRWTCPKCGHKNQRNDFCCMAKGCFYERITETPPMPPSGAEIIADLREALAPLAAIADAYDANELDDEARRFWGVAMIRQNTTPPEHIELYSGRGGKRLLTLADCFAARAAITKAEGKS